MSGLDFYADLLQGGRRLEAFRRGIASAVGPGDVVLEVGTGLGTFAFFAAQAGSTDIWAVESHPVVHVAETLAAANGWGGAIRFVRGAVPDAELPEEVDVLVFEDFPVRFMDRPTYALLERLVREHLRSGGRMVPRAGRLSLAPVESRALRGTLLSLGAGDAPHFGIDWRPLRPLLANAPRKASLDEADLRGVAVQGPVLPLLPVPGAADLGLEGTWDADSEAHLDALALWFDLEVAEGEWISNRPSEDPEPWGQWILPLDPPLPVECGARVEARVTVEDAGDGAPGWMSWSARAGAEARRGHEFAGLALGEAELSALNRGEEGG